MISALRSAFLALVRAARTVCIVLDALGEMAGYICWAAVGLLILSFMVGGIWIALS